MLHIVHSSWQINVKISKNKALKGWGWWVTDHFLSYILMLCFTTSGLDNNPILQQQHSFTAVHMLFKPALTHQWLEGQFRSGLVPPKVLGSKLIQYAHSAVHSNQTTTHFPPHPGNNHPIVFLENRCITDAMKTRAVVRTAETDDKRKSPHRTKPGKSTDK